MENILKPIGDGIMLILNVFQQIWNGIISLIPNPSEEELLPVVWKVIQENWNNPGVIFAIAILAVLLIKILTPLFKAIKWVYDRSL